MGQRAASRFLVGINLAHVMEVTELGQNPGRGVCTIGGQVALG